MKTKQNRKKEKNEIQNQIDKLSNIPKYHVKIPNLKQNKQRKNKKKLIEPEDIKKQQQKAVDRREFLLVA